MLPSIFGRGLFDDFRGFPFGEFNHHTTDLMKTDVKEKGSNYELTVDMPDIEKENVITTHATEAFMWAML